MEGFGITNESTQIIKYYYGTKESPNIATRPYGLEISRSQIIYFSPLQTGHNLLHLHAFRLSLNSSPLCTRHSHKADRHTRFILFKYPAFVVERNILRASLERLGVAWQLEVVILGSFFLIIIPLVGNYFSKSDFCI